MKIKNKLIVNILLIILFGCGILIVEYINKNATSKIQENEKLFERITMSSFKVSTLSHELIQYPGEPRPKVQWKKEYNNLGDLINQIPLEDRDILYRYKKLSYSYSRLLYGYNKINESIELLKRGKLKRTIYENRIERLSNDLFVEARTIVSSSYLLKGEVVKKYNEKLDKLLFTTILMVIVMIVVVLSFALYIARGIIKELDNLNEGAKKVTSGEFSYRVEENSKDELGEFAKSFNYMVSKLSQTMTSKEELEVIIDERTDELKRSRLAAISIMEDINIQKELLDKSNKDLGEQIIISKKTQSELEAAKKEAEYANKSKSIFLANMSHELRTPLNAIMGFSDLLRKNNNLSVEQKETLEIIHKSGNHLLRLINDVLDLAKIEAGKVAIEKEAFDLGNLINESLDLMSQKARSKGLKIELDQSSDFPRYIISDKNKIRQILLNFLSNAVKYTRQGGVKVMLDSKEGMLHMEVSDSGVGISKEDITKVFEPFIQVGGSSAKTGTGLGLTITKQFAELLGGSVDVYSELGVGSSFWVKIPYESADKDSVKLLVKEDEREIIGLDETQKDTKILIVEDQAENRLLLRSLLNILGLCVKEAVNGKEAVEIFKEWKPDLIWMDRRMPIMNGEDATKEIRKLQGGDKTIIIALTASAFHEDKEMMIEAGMDDFVAKPYRHVQIYEAMKKYLNLNYIYNHEKEKEIKEQLSYSLEELEEGLLKLEGELLDELYNGVILLDSELIKPILDKIGKTDKSLSNILEDMVSNYDYQSILKVIQSIQKG